MLPGQFAPRSKSANRTLANSLPGHFVPGNFCGAYTQLYIFSVAGFRAISLRGAKVPASELARVLLADSLLGANGPGSEKSVNHYHRTKNSHHNCNLNTSYTEFYHQNITMLTTHRLQMAHISQLFNQLTFAFLSSFACSLQPNTIEALLTFSDSCGNFS